MKDTKLKSLVKAAKKTAKKDIEISLIHKLQEVTVLLGNPSKKLEKAIKKGAKQLAKKIAKDLKVDRDAVVAAFKETEAAKTPKTAEVELVVPVPPKSEPAAESPVPAAKPKPIVKKTVAVAAAPAKPVAKKATPATPEKPVTKKPVTRKASV